MFGKGRLEIGEWKWASRVQRKYLLANHRSLITLLLTLVMVGAATQTVTAHSAGAAVLADVVAGPYHLFAYMQPDPSLVGAAHVAVAVTLPAGDSSANGLLEPVTDAQVQLRWEPRSQPQRAFTVDLPAQSTGGDLFYEMDVAIPFADLWRVTIEVNGAAGSGSASFERPVVATHPINWWIVGGASAGLAILVGLIIGWQRVQRLPKG